MSLWKRIINLIFKKQVSKKTDLVAMDEQPAKRFDVSLVTPKQVGNALNALNAATKATNTPKKIKHNPRLQYRKKKSQAKNWAKWRV